MLMLSQLLTRVPMCIIWVVAIVVAITRWNRHPMVSVAVVTAGAIELLLAAGSSAMGLVIERFGTENVGVIYGAIGLLYNIPLGVLLWATFAQRPEMPPPPSRADTVLSRE